MDGSTLKVNQITLTRNNSPNQSLRKQTQSRVKNLTFGEGYKPTFEQPGPGWVWSRGTNILSANK